ncbi:MAG TPA: transposase [Rhodanobacter sp.]|nr:transposase [Rhodanobacter sp.]
MARYGQAFKDRAVARLLTPESSDIHAVTQAVGVSAFTLERWRTQALAAGQQSGGWTAAAQLDAVVTTAAMSEAEVNVWCRSKGLFPSELAQWRQVATGALERPADAATPASAAVADRRRVRELERELRRKERLR